MAYAELEPFGELREDLRMAQIALLLAEPHRDRKRQPRPFQLRDFMLDPDMGTIRQMRQRVEARLQMRQIPGALVRKGEEAERELERDRRVKEAEAEIRAKREARRLAAEEAAREARAEEAARATEEATGKQASE